MTEILMLVGIGAVGYLILRPLGEWLAEKDRRQARADEWFGRVGLTMLALGLLSVAVGWIQLAT